MLRGSDLMRQVLGLADQSFQNATTAVSATIGRNRCGVGNDFRKSRVTATSDLEKADKE